MERVLRAALWTLRQRRYARLTALMVVIAGICIAAGTWQIQRYQQSVRDNNALKHNAHAAAVALSPALVPLVGTGPAPDRDAIRYRTVTASGTYLSGHEQFVRGASQGNDEGYLVLEPFRTASGVLLVLRGFVAGDSGNGNPKSVAAPPTGLVRISGRLETASTENDRAGTLSHGEIRAVNPTEQAGRLGQPVFNAYVALTAGQPGTSGVAVVPKPDLSNPAGGAYEAQHLAYIVQWYLFAVLALAAPFAMSRAETREAQRRFLGLEPGARDFDRALAGAPAGLEFEAGAVPIEAGAVPIEARAVPIEAGAVPIQAGAVPIQAGAVPIQAGAVPIQAGAAATRALSVRGRGTVTRANGASPARWQRGNRLADRYGRSFGARADDLAPEGSTVEQQDPRPVERAGRPIAVREPVLGEDRPRSADQPYRSPDGYHGSYNDFLWKLAMADGNLPAGEDDDAAPRPLTIAVVQPDGRAVITSSDPSEPPGTPPADPGR